MLSKSKTQTRTHKRRMYALAFLMPFLGYLFVMIFSRHAPFGSSSILYSDMYHQYYPFFLESRRTLLRGGSLLYNWNMGMGVDYLSLIAYYLASPLNLLSVLFPEKWMLGYFSLMVPVKLGLAGLFFTIFLDRAFPATDELAPAFFGASYGLCAWALGYQWNIMWLDTFALLPLVILGMVSMLKERRFVLYTVTLFLSVASNYYIGLFTCIFVALCFFSYEICYFKNFRRFWGDLGMMFLFSVLALAMTAFLEYPAFIGLGRTNSSVNQFPTTFSLNIASENTMKGLWDAMRQVAGNTVGGLSPTFKEGLPNLYCGIFPLILALQFFTNRKFKFREKLMNLLMLLFFMFSFIIRQLDYIWHGFHFTNMIPYRFSFLFSFIVLCMAYRSYRYLNRYKPWQMIVSGLLFLGLAACSDQNRDVVFLIYNLVFFAIFAALLLCRKHSRVQKITTDDGVTAQLVPLTDSEKSFNRRLALLVLLSMGLEMICSLVLFGVNFGGTLVSNYPRGTADAADVYMHMRWNETDAPFYRTEVAHTQSLNDDALNGYSGITMFSSAVDVRVTKYMAALGFGAKPSYNRYAYEETSPVANLFLNLKYLVTRDGKLLESDMYHSVYNMGQVYLQRNEAWLPLGFLVEPSLKALSVEDPSAGSFSFQNEMFSRATGMTDPVQNLISAFEVTAGQESTNYTQRHKTAYVSYNTAASDQITIGFTVPVRGFVTLDLMASKRNGLTVYRNSMPLFSESISLDQMMAVGSCDAGDYIEVVFDCSSNESGRIDMSAAVTDDTLFWYGYDLLAEHPFSVTKMTDTYLSGSVTADHTSLLYTSIPYSENWHAYLDGVETEIVPICGAMIGLDVTGGTHAVELRYENPEFRLGFFVTLAATSVFAVLCLLAYYPRKKGKYAR